MGIYLESRIQLTTLYRNESVSAAMTTCAVAVGGLWELRSERLRSDQMSNATKRENSRQVILVQLVRQFPESGKGKQ